MSGRIIVFAGTSEGHRLYEFCEGHQIDALFCVATEYGRETLEYGRKKDDTNCPQKTADDSAGRCGTSENEELCKLEILSERLDEPEMEELFRREKPVMVIDATHPYAVEVTENIRRAAEAYQAAETAGVKGHSCGSEASCADGRGCGPFYYRILRSLTEREDGDAEKSAEKETAAASGRAVPDPYFPGGADRVVFDDMRQAVAYLERQEGNILAATGSKGVEELCKLTNYADRVYLRILPSVEMLRKSLESGFPAKHVICMQGPFSEEINAAMLREFHIRYLLTKQSGRAGGFPEKCRAAKAVGAQLVVLAPPREEQGCSVEEMERVLINLGENK